MTKAEAGAPARERLIRAASDLFRRYGQAAVGVEAIVAEAGAAKATLYKAFGSREGLVEAVLERRAAEWRTWFFAEIARAGADPRARLARIFPALRLSLDSNDDGFDFFRGGAAEAPLKEIARAHEEALRAEFERLARDLGAPAPGVLARRILLLFDGAVAGAARDGTGEAADLAHDMLGRMIDEIRT